MSALSKLYPTPAESDLLTAVLEYLGILRLKAWRCNAGTVRLRGRVFRGAPKGTPDVLGYLAPRGRMFAIELKTERGRVSPEQATWQADATAAGVLVATCRSLVEVKSAVTSWQRTERGQS